MKSLFTAALLAGACQALQLANYQKEAKDKSHGEAEEVPAVFQDAFVHIIGPDFDDESKDHKSKDGASKENELLKTKGESEEVAAVFDDAFVHIIGPEFDDRPKDKHSLAQTNA
jgi:hypothetical protein